MVNTPPVPHQPKQITAPIPRFTLSPIEHKTDRDARQAEIDSASVPAGKILLADMLDIFTTPYWNKSHTDKEKAIIAASFMEEMVDLPAFAVWQACKDWNSHNNPRCEWLPKAGTLSKRAFDIWYNAVKPSREIVRKWDHAARLATEAAKPPRKPFDTDKILKNAGYGHLIHKSIKESESVKSILTETEALGVAERAMMNCNIPPLLVKKITDEMGKVIYKMKTPSGMKKVGTAVKTAVKNKATSN